MRGFTAFLLLTLVSTQTAQECRTPLFRDRVATDATKTRFTLDNIGETDPGFITGLPLINSSHPLTIRIGDFTIPTLLLGGRDNLSPHYWLTALDLQQGAAGANCWSSGVVEELSVEVREASGYRAIDVPFREGRDSTNSNPTLNLRKLGGAAGGRVVRLSFEPMGGDGVRIKVGLLVCNISWLVNALPGADYRPSEQQCHYGGVSEDRGLRVRQDRQLPPSRELRTSLPVQPGRADS